MKPIEAMKAAPTIDWPAVAAAEAVIINAANNRLGAAPVWYGCVRADYSSQALAAADKANCDRLLGVKAVKK